MGYFSKFTYLLAMTPSRPSIAWDEVNNAPHEVERSEELIGAAAAYQAAEKYEENVAANGKQARKPGSSEGNSPWACGCFRRQNRRD
ncbi:hypothetical protein COH20_008039 [Aspergillus flavus]|nr:hypothetical protein COH20_008039 [Aspergillus flavus]